MRATDMGEQLAGSVFDEIQHDLEALRSSVVRIRNLPLAKCRREIQKKGEAVFRAWRANPGEIHEVLVIHRQDIVKPVKILGPRDASAQT